MLTLPETGIDWGQVRFLRAPMEEAMFGLFRKGPAKKPSLSEGFGVLGGLAAIVGVLADVLADTKPAGEPEVPYWDQGGTNDWHYRQWDHAE